METECRFVICDAILLTSVMAHMVARGSSPWSPTRGTLLSIGLLPSTHIHREICADVWSTAASAAEPPLVAGIRTV
jgi:hypothetical protein